jgi:putative transposase
LKKEHSAEKEDLINQIGQLTVDVNWLKKEWSSLRNTEKKELIKVDNQKITVKHQCELLRLPNSTAYYKSHCAAGPSQEEIDIKNAINTIHYDERSYGCRRIRIELRKLGFQGIGKRRVRRYMEAIGIVPFYPGPNLSKRDLQNLPYPYLLRNVAITHVNQVWGINITYFGTLNGFM